MSEPILAWHWMPREMCLRYGDGRAAVVGETLHVDPPVDAEHPLRLCERGMHASEDILDALQYAPGPVVCRAEVGGEVIRGDDKLCGEWRRVIWAVDAEDILRAWARWCALQVVDLWDAPATVREYLETGRDDLRDAAWYAAMDAAWDAAWYAAMDAAWDAARAAARDVAMAAAMAASWAAAMGAAMGAAWDAASDAAWDSAKAVSWGAANAAAKAAARAAQRDKLLDMVKSRREAE